MTTQHRWTRRVRSLADKEKRKSVRQGGSPGLHGSVPRPYRRVGDELNCCRYLDFWQAGENK